MLNPVKTVGILSARPGKAEDLKALLVGMVDACRAEPGNLRWDVWQAQNTTGRYVIDELYVNGAAVSAHHETPHFKAYAAKINDLAERQVLMLDPAAIA